MIPLQIPIDPLPTDEAVVARLRTSPGGAAATPSGKDAILLSHAGGVAEFDLAGFSLRAHCSDPREFDGDVVMILPQQKSAHRLIRASSPHNTFLVTEQCDQLCVMCSQPPKNHHVDLFSQFEEAALLAPRDMYLGISGGEPLLHKDRLFPFIERVWQARPDIKFHILTNAQHFSEADMAFLRSDAASGILWGIPIYAADAHLHDRIVGKIGAFQRLTAAFALLGRAGATVELRTVVVTLNVDSLPELAQFITVNLSFSAFWAIMQLEAIGFGRKNWDEQFVDTSVYFSPLADALDIALARDMAVSLYNFPACTVPPAYRSLAAKSISDWKQKYLDVCIDCTIKETCGGFFQWYPQERGFRRLGKQ